jgi:predicted O-methyltransferase YrrM
LSKEEIPLFHDIPEPIDRRMVTLEAMDARDRQDGTPHLQRVRQIPPVTGRLLALLAAGAPPGAWIEAGTSAGYSALWLALAARATNRSLTTFELLPEKVALAQETFRVAQVEDVVTLVAGDVRAELDAEAYRDIAFCFLDAEKDIYGDVYTLVVPRLVRGGLLLADNVISHGEQLAPFVQHAEADPRVDALVLTVGKGLLLCRKAG